MKSRALVLLLTLCIGSGLSGISQVRQKGINSLFSTLHKQQVVALNSKRVTKAQVDQINSAMKATGNKIIRTLNARDGVTYEMLISTMKTEFKSLNTKVNGVIPGGNSNIFAAEPGHGLTELIKFLQQKGLAAGLSSKVIPSLKNDLVTSLKTTMVSGFGGQDLGNYFVVK